MIDHVSSETGPWRLAAGLALLLACGLPFPPRSMGQDRGRGGKKGPQSEVFYTNVPAHPFDVILTRPTSQSVTASVLVYADMDGYLEYGTKQGDYSNKTATFHFRTGEPRQIVLQPLQPDTRYFYRLRHRPAPASTFAAGADWTFHTQRSPGDSFTFSVQADFHLDENASPEVYKITLANALAGQPDFYIDLGDTFMTDKRRSDFKRALPQYLAQRYYFGLVCRSAPLFLVLGNHDGESGMRHDGTRNSMAAWSNELRKRYFPNPRPDGFYTGNGASDPVLGLLEDYYAWEWGDALFIVLDPYWPTTGRGRGDNWNWTLGAAQYRWLAKTLEESQAPLKFVFVHHPVGAKGQPIRGGVEAARYNEWGGRNDDGSDGFREHRPGWAMPIHQLLVKNKVAAVFHGHDHMFAREEMDGVVYQEVPQPGNTRAGNPRNAQEYGYVHGDVLGGSGYVRVKVAQGEAIVDYILSVLPREESGSRKNGAVAYSYRVRSGMTPRPGEGQGRGQDGDRPPRRDGDRRPPPRRAKVEPLVSGTKGTFTAHGNGAVTDSSTGLMWQQSDGGEMTWQKAGAYCRELSLAGYRDWRLPATAESFSILDHTQSNPALDPAVFPPSDAEYWWTSETRADDATRVWVTNAGGGAGPHPVDETLSAGGDRQYHVRCTRGTKPAQTLQAKFTGNRDGTATDQRTGLMWQQAEAPDAMTWEEALQVGKNFSLAGYRDWRLPTIKELQSLNDSSVVRPSLDRAAFPQASPSEFWSATTMVNRPERAWTVDFRFGIVSYKDRTEKLRVRAVRAGN